MKCPSKDLPQDAFEDSVIDQVIAEKLPQASGADRDGMREAVKLFLKGDFEAAGKVPLSVPGRAEWLLPDVAENISKCLLPEAQPGIQSQKRQGMVILYRTARDPREVAQVLNAARTGNIGGAFTTSTHISPELVGHDKAFISKFEAAVRKGKKPLFTTPYASVAAFYRTYSSKETKASTPVTFAIEVPEDAVIHESRKAGGLTSDRAYSLTYPDTEIVVDGNQVTRVWHVPSELVTLLGKDAEAIHEKASKTGFMGKGFTDKDQPLALAAADAIRDLRRPPMTLNRPFIEVPAMVNGVPVMKGDRVVLAGGAVGEVNDWRKINPEIAYSQKDFLNDSFVGISGKIRCDGFLKEFYNREAANVPDKLVVERIGAGERFTSQQQEKMAKDTFPTIEAFMRSEIKLINARLPEAVQKGDKDWQERMQKRSNSLSQFIDRVKQGANPCAVTDVHFE